MLRLGRNAGTFDVKRATHEQIVGAIMGAEFGADEPEAELQPTGAVPAT